MTISYDFHSPFMAAAIITADGDRVPLWSNNGPGGQLQGSPATVLASGLESLPWLQQLDVTLQLAYLPVIRATLTPPYTEGIKFLNSELIEWGVSRLEVQMGYAAGAIPSGIMTPVFTGLLLKPDVTIGQDIQIVLNAQGVGGFSATRQEGRQQFNDQPRANIISFLAEGSDPANRRNLDVDFSEVRALPPGSEEQRLLFDTSVTISQGSLTDYQLIYNLVNESQCFMTQTDVRRRTAQGEVTVPTLKVMPKSARFQAEPTKTFQLYPGRFQGRIGPASGIWPIITASSPTTAVYMPGALRGFVIQGVDSKTREVTSKVVGDAEALPARANDGAAAPGESEDFPGTNDSQDGATQHFGAPDDPRVEEAAKAEFSNLTSNMGVKMIIRAPGVPELVPGEMVMVRGLGDRISEDKNGRYMVHKVTHSFGAGGGYETEWEGVSNSGAILAGVPAQGPKNAGVPAEQSDRSARDLGVPVDQGFA